MSNVNLKNLRVWGVYDSLNSRIEYLSELQSSCRKMIKLFDDSHRKGMILLRFDICPLYCSADK